MKKSKTIIIGIFSLIFLFSELTISASLFGNMKPFNDYQFQVEKTWVSIMPIQCQQNPWEQNAYAKNVDESLLVRKYLISNNIMAVSIKKKQKYSLVCMSCSCPRGDEINVLIYEKDLDKIMKLGFLKTL